jgi:uncharacterized membrane protein YfcA
VPELFPDVVSFVACALVMAGAQLVYATFGFGAGMVSIALLAIVLPDLVGAVGVLLILTLVTEVWVLAHAWREVRARLLLGLVPTMAVGLWLGTELLVAGDVGGLKRALGVVVAAAGVWFLYEERARGRRAEPRDAQPQSVGTPASVVKRPVWNWTSLPIGLVSGVLGGLFGTGGPPVIIFLKAYRLDKGAFRATLLWYFLLMSLFRAGTYVHAEVLTKDILLAALWLLPASVAGILIGMVIHRRVSESQFGVAVSVLLVVLGVLLLIGVGR